MAERAKWTQATSPISVSDLAEVRKRREDDNYKRRVLKAWDDMEHAERRKKLQKKADVERAARKRL